MFYKVVLQDHVRVPPRLFNLPLKDSIVKSVRQRYEGVIDPSVGIVVDVLGVKSVNEGVVIPGDGAGYYDTVFELLTFRPEMHEVVVGRIRDIADFGAFLTMGPIDGMIHISQTMDDFVSFSKDKVLLGRDSKRSLKVGDVCRARVIAVSFKDVTNPKIGLTMRQPGLGKLEWIAEEFQAPVSAEKKPAEKKAEKPAKEDKKSKEKK